MVMFGMVLGGDVEETSMTEGSKMMEKLCAGRVSERVRRVMEVGIVLSDPARWEETMFSGDVMTEGVI